ncbi:MAG TPA: hypothetical protein VNN17_12265 [Terriglobia bacterium]|nr:hypothetical protein [Terriglobia bacterium]
MSAHENDPLDLERVDREIRINRMEEELRQLSGDAMRTGESAADCPPEVREKFLEHVLKFERGEWTTHAELLRGIGIELPPPDELDDAGVTAKLWEVIRGLERLHTFLYSTDHLDDRALYTLLWAEALRERTVDMSDEPTGACHLNLIGSGSAEDTNLYLKYYADEASRQRWQRQFPNDVLPPHEDPPHDRDRHLPRR